MEGVTEVRVVQRVRLPKDSPEQCACNSPRPSEVTNKDRKCTLLVLHQGRQRTLAVDALVVRTGAASRRCFEPRAAPGAPAAAATAGSGGGGGLVLLLSVCTANASHCEAVVPAGGARVLGSVG